MSQSNSFEGPESELLPLMREELSHQDLCLFYLAQYVYGLLEQYKYSNFGNDNLASLIVDDLATEFIRLKDDYQPNFPVDDFTLETNVLGSGNPNINLPPTQINGSLSVCISLVTAKYATQAEIIINGSSS